ncbi:MAG: response regulator transcription factor [Caldilineaceae bacterium]|nr:response regulator transcription factor [Caldilineaceae bacterium]
MSIRVFLVDGYAAMRTLLGILLETQPGFVVVGEASDEESAAGAISYCQPDIIVIDRAPSMHHNLDILQRLRMLCPSARMILLTFALDMDHEEVRQALDLGVLGFVPKEKVGDELIEAIRTVSAGECYVSRKLLEYGLELPPLK